MNAEQDASPAAGAQTGGEAHTPEALSVGQRLRAAREAKAYSLGEVASKLKLTPSQVEALENGDSSRLQCNTITRGFIRNYARLVGLDPAELMSLLDRSAKPRENELAVPNNINVRVPDVHGVQRRDYVRVVAGVLVLLTAVVAYFFLPPDFVPTTISAFKEKLGLAESKRVQAADGESEASGRATRSEPAAVVAAAETQPAREPIPPPSTAVDALAATAGAEPAAKPAAAASSVLKFAFAKASWVEVKDRNGKVIFSQLNAADSQREVSGQPPFSLLIGNASGVSLHYKGKAVDLSKRSKDDVARVTLE